MRYISQQLARTSALDVYLCILAFQIHAHDSRRKIWPRQAVLPCFDKIGSIILLYLNICCITISTHVGTGKHIFRLLAYLRRGGFWRETTLDLVSFG